MTSAFPPLPPCSLPGGWPQKVIAAYNCVADSYVRTHQLLSQENGDVVQIQAIRSKIEARVLPVYDALVSELDDIAWAERSAQCIGYQLRTLDDTVENLRNK